MRSLDDRTRSEIARTLEGLSSTPLELCPEFPRLAARWEAWWEFRADRALLVASAPRSAGIRMDKALEHLAEPETWLRIRLAQVENTHYVGEAIPSVRVDLGPVATGAYLGAPLHIASREETTWQDPVLEGWEETTKLSLDPANRWLELTRRLVRAVARSAAGRFVVCLPDLAGAVDVLANLRGSERLCLDVLEYPGELREAAARVVDAWDPIYVDLHRDALGQGAGVVQWLGCWSRVPYTLPTCDFSALIGPVAFREVCLPSLAEQARRAGRCVFHLDGPDAARHADTLIREPAITAIQYTPGAATPSAVAKLPLLRSIQAAGKPLYVSCLSADVPRLAGELDGRGLVLQATDVRTPAEADALLGHVGA